jgi:hypothetical protein
MLCPPPGRILAPNSGLIRFMLAIDVVITTVCGGGAVRMSDEKYIVEVATVAGKSDEIEVVVRRLHLLYPDVRVTDTLRDGRFHLASPKRGATELRCIWKALLLAERRHPADQDRRADVMAALLA